MKEKKQPVANSSTFEALRLGGITMKKRNIFYWFGVTDTHLVSTRAPSQNSISMSELAIQQLIDMTLKSTETTSQKVKNNL